MARVGYIKAKRRVRVGLIRGFVYGGKGKAEDRGKRSN